MKSSVNIARLSVSDCHVWTCNSQGFFSTRLSSLIKGFVFFLAATVSLFLTGK